jgi:hypothetical protein
MEKKLKVYRLEEESLTKKLKRYIPKPGIVGTVGAIGGAGLGSLTGFAGGAAYHLITQTGNYLTNGNAIDLLVKTYEQAAMAGGQWGLVGGIAGLILFSKGRDYLLSLFGLKE